MKRSPSPVLITDAEPSQEDELKRRERRYISMMLLRAACVIVAVILVMVRVPLLALWVTLCGLGMVFLPWFAVIIANDGPAKDEHRLKRYRRNTQQSHALPSQPSGKVIDSEDTD
jgi:hypothetical protein